LGAELLIYGAIAAIVTGIWLFALHRARRERQRSILKSENLISASIADASDGEMELARAVKLQLYHFFEDQWQRHSDMEKPSDLLLRLFWDCADDKLEMFSDLALSLWRINHYPQPMDIVRSILGAAALAELNSRRYKNDRLVADFAMTTKMRVLQIIDEFCPTLQIDMWRARFSEATSTPRHSPFMTGT
jgi:hypothetical protein